jgi:hypothetical protein
MELRTKKKLKLPEEESKRKRAATKITAASTPTSNKQLAVSSDEKSYQGESFDSPPLARLTGF